VADLTVLARELGDLDEAEHYSRSALENLKSHCDRKVDDPRGSRRCRALTALADALTGKVKKGWEENQRVQVKTEHLAACFEAESLYMEAIAILEAGGKTEREFILGPVIELNRLYTICGSPVAATELSLKTEIELKKEFSFPILEVAKAISNLSLYYTRKFDFEAPSNHETWMAVHKMELLAARSNTA
jgi:hypothetical protein